MIKKILTAEPVIEGAGVRLKRVFGFYEKGEFDPFLLLDHFGSSNPNDYLQGFPWHPHRGMETVTYLLEGSVEHGDSLGNKGVINNGDVQWMTAGSGIIHQEMPKKYDGNMQGFQLWVNLPGKLKMTEPKYRDVLAEQIPVIQINENVKVKLISGKYLNNEGAVTDLGIDIFYFDVNIDNAEVFEYEIIPEYTVFAYVYEGEAIFFDSKSVIEKNQMALLEKGNQIKVTTNKSVKFLLVGGKPLNEPIAWQGPIVMNTQEELQQAFEEYRNGTFIK
ncbi:MAG: hypothetical protein A2X13_12960 [Bacteroidetes bacterium GWC2_33_15]|nr:MAG: hypothetical protein A2X10_13735 [Bacteroidetes bacterium GWA2_33_15]OFX50688.1 MAG: hypothetical protein A2X13_12960 [Bacteroidetes bacterium GWC2_33_15]OFX63217.1 MAG: hypothetical protein A2X15_01840 [Bacteroidetes bacterium GWB2_32_14]OFX69837.1 MAG: hypothetical protein A2X14_05635 [Bacteroidetes bacterium GWD2_33_33]HAN19884.1 hypothetical protein [Bacteroidales bacterium]